MKILANRLLSVIVMAFSWEMSALSAHADQCSLIPKRQALAAITRLEPDQTIYSLCELCGEKQPQAIAVKTIAMVSGPSENLWRIKINDRDIDLAYTYVRSNNMNERDLRSKVGNNSYINLSIIAKCPATGFTPILSIK